MSGENCIFLIFVTVESGEPIYRKYKALNIPFQSWVILVNWKFDKYYPVIIQWADQRYNFTPLVTPRSPRPPVLYFTISTWHSSLSVKQCEHLWSLLTPATLSNPPQTASIGFHYFTYIIILQRAIKWYHRDSELCLIILSYLHIPLIHHIIISSLLS